MVLSSIVPENWLYGFAGTVMTGSPFFGIALQAAIFLSFTWLHWHRSDPPPLDIHVHITQPAATWMGTLIGALFLGFFRPPRFVDFRLFDSRGNFRPWFFVLVVLALGLIAGVYLLEAGDTKLGVPLTVVFGIGVLGLIVYGYWMRNFVPDGDVQIKYLLLFSVLAVIPAANDYPLTIGGVMGPQDIRPWNAVIWGAAFIAAFIIFYYFSVVVKPGHIERKWWRNRSGPWTSSRVFVLALFAAVALVYIPSLIADQIGFDEFGTPASVPPSTPEDEEQKIWYVLIGTSVGSGLILLLMGMWWYNARAGFQLASDVDVGAGDVLASGEEEEDGEELMRKDSRLRGRL